MCRALSAETLICRKSLYLCRRRTFVFHFHCPGHRWQMSWQRLTARQMTEHALFVMLAHPHVTHVLLYVSVLTST